MDGTPKTIIFVPLELIQWKCFTIALLSLCLPEYAFASPVYPGDDASKEDLVRYYFSCGYSRSAICGFLLFNHGILLSVSIIKRLLRRLGLRRNGAEAPLADIVLKIVELHENGFRNVGIKTLWKILNVQCGLRVTQRTVGRILSVLDADGLQLRARRRLRRRVYVNMGPNYLIHVDGYDKLKSFGIAIHGAIDGYSRKLLWLKAGPSNNNPKYIARFYLEYVRSLGRFPRCVRMDAGTENSILRDIQTAFSLLSGRESNSPYVLVGRSSANQRIERFWGCLRKAFTDFWLNYFKDLRDSGEFVDNDVFHIQSVRFCFLPIIHEQLRTFETIWNVHRIRRQRNNETPSGVPNILFYQPEVYNTRDYSIDLPCDIPTIDAFAEVFTEGYPLYGCSEDYIQTLEAMTNIGRCDFPRPTNIQEARLLFRAITNRLEEL